MNHLTCHHTVVSPQPLASLRLVCFYHAGGSAAVFRPWAQLLAPLVEIVAVELPGHGARVYEPLFRSMDALVPAIADELAPLLAGKDFAFFGHSMGALVSFEMARHLRRQSAPLPRWLFVSGRQAPQIPPQTAFYRLADNDLVQALIGLEGTPPPVLQHAELLELFLPIIRADFMVCETYTYAPEPALPCPIVAYSGSDDHSVSQRHLELWREQTRASFDLQLFPGGHFYLRAAQTALLQSLRSYLLAEQRPAVPLPSDASALPTQALRGR